MNKTISKVLSIVLMSAMVCTYALGTTSTSGKPKEPEVKSDQMANYLLGKVTKKGSKSKNLKKKETVYVELNPDGSVSNTTVSDVIEVKGKEPINDKSILDDITNLKGDEKFTKTNDGKLVWENKGKDITYQGTTDAQPPISVDVSYSLDGEDISAKDLVGKSGEVQIQYKFNNNAKVKGYDYVPFVVVGGFIFDNETFKNIQIDNGKTADYEESKIVLGYSVPGLNDYLEKTLKNSSEYLNKISLPEQFTITADVEDFSMNMGILIATSSIGDFDIKDSIDLSNIQSKMKELQNGADQLVNGADQLANGTGKLASGGNTIKSGAKKLNKGLGKIRKGTRKLHKGVGDYDKGLKKGLNSVKSGSKDLAKGSKDLADGAKKVDDGAGEVNEGASSLDIGSKGLSGGISALKNGFDKENGIKDGASAIKNGTKSANTGVKKLVKILQDSPDSIQTQIDGIMAQVKQATGGSITTEAALKNLVEGINNAVKNGAKLETVLESKGLSVSSYYSLVEAYYSVSTLESVKASLAEQIGSHSQDIKDLTDGMQDLEDGSAALNSGINEAYAGILVLNGGASQLVDGTGKLTVGTNALYKGTNELYYGARKINIGMQTLADGVEVLNGKLVVATSQLLNASNRLELAMNQVFTGSSKLANGMKPFCNGIDQLDSGAKQLRDGSHKLNNEGIKKITSIFGEKAEEVIDNVQDLLDAGSSYNSFSGIDKKMDGQVKFIYKTSEIGVEE